MKQGIKFLHSLFEVAHVEFQTYDLDNRQLVFSSGLVHKLLGYSEEDFFKLSNDFSKGIVHPDDFQKVLTTIEKIIQSKEGEVIEMTVRLRRSDGIYIWVNSRQMILEKNLNNHVSTIVREVEDITRLIEIKNDLEQKVNQLKIVSFKNAHLLRSPVASIIGLIDLIDEQEITSEHNKQIFSFLKEAITKLDDIIREINDAARVE
ncbi:PAS domain-containing protein [Mucilaginibacter sp.]|uniref:PAS domain-containing protein n=1 Tax=Mucilaginibacter sp. TaxID=1882438 RepID=UPI0028469562|nr:PAS domain-containing protein [Mucilaginibacter sp.]MDR3695640.1 PAS domain-containing protein [Mucilaginibacter sp.]